MLITQQLARAAQTSGEPFIIGPPEHGITLDHRDVTVQTWWVELDESRLIAVSLSVSNGDSPPIFALQTLGSPQV